jgi:hypothetical protein
MAYDLGLTLSDSLRSPTKCAGRAAQQLSKEYLLLGVGQSPPYLFHNHQVAMPEITKAPMMFSLMPCFIMLLMGTTSEP